MSYVAPTPASFKARFAEFQAVSDTTLQVILNECIDQVGDTWLERDRAKAQMLLAAHILLMEGEPSRSNGAVSANDLIASGRVTSLKVGDLSATLSSRVTTDSSNRVSGSDYQATTYGALYYQLLRKNFSGAVAV